jgi:hypothetical protein
MAARHAAGGDLETVQGSYDRYVDEAVADRRTPGGSDGSPFKR